MSELITPAFASDTTIGRVLYSFTAASGTDGYVDIPNVFNDYIDHFTNRYSALSYSKEEGHIEHSVSISYPNYTDIRITYTHQQFIIYGGIYDEYFGMYSGDSLIHLVGY